MCGREVGVSKGLLGSAGETPHLQFHQRVVRVSNNNLKGVSSTIEHAHWISLVSPKAVSPWFQRKLTLLFYIPMQMPLATLGDWRPRASLLHWTVNYMPFEDEPSIRSRMGLWERHIFEMEAPILLPCRRARLSRCDLDTLSGILARSVPIRPSMIDTT